MKVTPVFRMEIPIIIIRKKKIIVNKLELSNWLKTIMGKVLLLVLIVVVHCLVRGRVIRRKAFRGGIVSLLNRMILLNRCKIIVLWCEENLMEIKI